MEEETSERARRLTIGQMAEANGVSPRLLRHYQEKGLIEPAYVNAATGHRYYDLLQSDRIDMIRELQSIDFSLDEIAEVCASRSLDDLRRRVEEHARAIEEEQRRLEMAHDIATSMATYIDFYENAEILDQIVFERRPPCTIVTFAIPEELAPQRDPQCTRTEWERVLRYVKAEMAARGLPLELFRNISCSVPLRRIQAGDFRASYVFVRLNAEAEEYVEHATTVPGGIYLTYLGREMYRETGEGYGTYMLPRFLDYAEAKGVVPCGDYYEEILCRWPLVLGEDRKLFRLSLQVKAA